MSYKPSTAFFGGDRMPYGTGFSRNHMYSPPRNIRQDSQYVNHVGFSEMEQRLQRQRLKFKEVRQNLQNQLDNERKARIDFENKLIKLKEEVAKSQLVISELEFRQNNILHENQDIIIENEKLRAEVVRLEETYRSKIFELEGELNSESKNHEDTKMSYHSEFEKFKKEGQEYVEKISFEYERKIKALEEKLKVLQANRKELAFDNKRLNDLITTSKINFEEEVRELTNRMRDEQLKKVAFLTKSFEQRIRSLQQTKQILTKKNNDTLKILQEKDREAEQRLSEFNGQVEQLRQQTADQINKNSQLGYILQKLKAQILEKDSVLKRFSGETSQEAGYLRQQIQQKKRQNEQLSLAVRDLKQNIKDMTADHQRKRAQMLDKINFLESQTRKYKDDYTKLHSTLKTKINEAINNFGQQPTWHK